MSKLILVLNCGSSSIKFALFETSAGKVPRQRIWGGKVNGILDGRKTTKEEVGLRMTNLVKEEQA